ncbi:MAG: hypothetical protein NVS3B20_06610 [Polyangiales bacterium]
MSARANYAQVASLLLPVAAAALAYLVYANVIANRASGRQSIEAQTTAMPSSSVAPPSVSQVFNKIYDEAAWGRNDAGVGFSGTGSTLTATTVYRAYLQAFLKEHDVKSVVDAGCGDWEFSHAVDWSGIDYKGYDVVSSLIEKDTKSYGAPNIHFYTANILEDPLPAADLLVCKNVLQHLSNRDVTTFLGKLSKYKHVLLTDGVDNSTLSSDNYDIVEGKYRPLDLTKPPFSLAGRKVLLYFDGHYTHQVVYWHRE